MRAPGKKTLARWFVPKMVKNGHKSSFVFLRLIWASLVGKSRPLKDGKSWSSIKSGWKRALPHLIRQTAKFDIVVASRNKLPRISEKIASKTLGKLVGVSDTLSNFRAFRKEAVPKFNLRGGETFGAEFLVTAKKKGLTIGELKYEPPSRRRNPRIGGTIRANLRIFWALIKSLALYAF